RNSSARVAYWLCSRKDQRMNSAKPTRRALARSGSDRTNDSIAGSALEAKGRLIWARIKFSRHCTVAVGVGRRAGLLVASAAGEQASLCRDGDRRGAEKVAQARCGLDRRDRRQAV